MGLSSKKTTSTQTNKPIYSKQIEGASGELSNVYQAQAPKVQQYADTIGGLLPKYIEQAQNGNPAVNAASRYVTDTLGGDPASNPYLDQIVSQSNDNLGRYIKTQMGTRGLSGGSDEMQAVARQLAQNETGLRYQDYDREMQRRAQAAGMAPGIAAGDFMALAPALSVADFASQSPMNAALKYAAGQGGLLGQYQDVKGTQKSNPGFMDFAGLALQGASLFSDARLKTDIRRVGFTDAGQPVYTYRYGGEGPFHMGVMAQETPEEALGPEIGGFMTVDYRKVA